MKIGRNQPCPCGSGKKYKRCHYLNNATFSGPTITKLQPTPESEKIRIQLETQIRQRREKLRQFGIFIDFVVPTTFQGRKVWALASRLYPYEPENETFHEFIIHVLQMELGKEWWETQRVLPEGKQHFIFKCFRKHHEWKIKNEHPANRHGKLWAAPPDGYSRALLSLAFDVCSLIHAVHLPDFFLKKLRQYEGYQGVRYEIAVAAIFARMGYKIEFLDEKYEHDSNPPQHAEFIARNPITGEEIVIEVKSKERDGVLHEEGEFNPQRELRASIAKLYRHALEQRHPGKPFIIFIDMNLPLSPDVPPDQNEWVKAVTAMRDRAAFATKGQKSPHNAIVFTNYSYHYGTDQETGSGEWLLEKNGDPACPILSPDFSERFVPAIHSYGNVPNLDITVDG